MKIKMFFMELPLTVGALSILVCGHSAIAQDEYYGVFSGEPSLKVKSNENGRPTFLLLNDFRFTDPNGLEWVTPKGWEVDGASIPQFAWSIVGGPMSGKYLHASIIHDRYCDSKTRTAHDTHRNFYYGMLSKGVSISTAKVMYWAVRTFGPSWKIMKKPISPGVLNTRYVLKESDVKPPAIPENVASELVKNLGQNLSLSELDSLSDSLRRSFGSEEVQTVLPKLAPGEDMGNIEEQLRSLPERK